MKFVLLLRCAGLTSQEKVVAVNAASAYHAGGGFLTGGRHALEEAMCVQSSLYESLERGIGLADGLKVPSWARPPARRDGSPWVLHLPDDGVLLSPMVEVFRDGTMHGYGFRETATVLTAVVPLARKLSDSLVLSFFLPVVLDQGQVALQGGYFQTSISSRSD